MDAGPFIHFNFVHFFILSFLTSIYRMLYELSMPESIKDENIVYVLQELPGTKAGAPKINIMSASKYGKFKFLLPEFSQIIFSPGPLIFKLRSLLKDYTEKDYLLLTGDPAIIGVACSIVSDMTNGKYSLLKWDKQDRMYYPIKINLHEKGEIND